MAVPVGASPSTTQAMSMLTGTTSVAMLAVVVAGSTRMAAASVA
jgi:hypothetical protein